MAAEKDASEAIRSVVATLPNIQKLKPEQAWLLVIYWLWQIRVALGRSNSFKLQQSTRLQGSKRLPMERGQTLCTNEMYESLGRTRLPLVPKWLEISIGVNQALGIFLRL